MHHIVVWAPTGQVIPSPSDLVTSLPPCWLATGFVSGVGLHALYEAAPADRHEQFKVWFQQQDQPPVVAQPRPMVLQIPDDLSIPDFLRREHARETAHE